MPKREHQQEDTAIRKVGDLYNRTRLTPFIQKLFKKWLAWRR